MTDPKTPSNQLKTTQDKFLGGKVIVEQPAKGRHRAGLDAVYLAASLPEDTTGTVFDLGTGVGTAAFCAAQRLQQIKAVGVEVDPVTAELARKALSLPGNVAFADRVKIMETDLTAKGAQRHESGLASSIADHVIMNPPYYDSARFRVTPHSDRAPAHALDERGIEPWIRTAKDLLKDGGTLSIIFRADGLQDLLDPMQRRFGAIDIVPIRPTAEAPATRILVRAVAASKAPLQILPGFTLHEQSGGAFTPQATAVMREGKGLGLTNR
ncbi:tRNA1(Val) (adenine(37)-N6)-methyltransferase [Pseudovibrio axinellae]|uniref:tRNA1(Val) (Adenine(37)-N6)-methyltransferase n=1 Tax=Pseudovibrio axinellae TaxID=989403 RepID=A0A161V8H8_9HYPH|nr:methyltransferase [Pseudovibrio axinellae]KZL21279.1 tRNA1(Val) (adenine(37)-N6)-methyltransferase [Pseudovibrio axinellae]SEQ94555.1 tRNA1(Val) A37 N6-methylase TrmN6 [Pseudovibrio axinellae]